MTAVTEPRWTVPHPVEQFTYLHLAWDVAKAWDLVKDTEPSGQIDVAEAARTFGAPTAADMLPPADGSPVTRIYVGVGVDTAWCLANEPDYTRPVLIARRPLPSGDEVTMMIDGYHRLWRAWHDGVETLPGIVLTAEQERACRIR